MAEQERQRPTWLQIIETLENSVHLARVANSMSAGFEISSKNLDLYDALRLYKAALITICVMMDAAEFTVDDVTVIFNGFKTAERMREK